MLALRFAMKFNWRLILSFMLPLMLAIQSSYISVIVLDGKYDCRNFCTVFGNCADTDALFFYDIFIYLTIGLIMLSLVLPVVIARREKKEFETSIFLN